MLKTIFTPLKSTLFVATVLALSTLSTAPAYAGKHCKNVYVSALNKSGAKIKVIDMDYYDSAYNKWRSEPTRNEVIPAGKNWQESRRLEKVNAQATKIRIRYRKAKSKGLTKWSAKVHKAYSSSSVCGNGSTYHISLY